MPLFLDPSGGPVAICDRHHGKVYLSTLIADRQSPGLRVCPDCADDMDPWRLPARRSETITLQYPRPDAIMVTGAVSSSYPSLDIAIAGLAVASLAVAGVGYE